MSQFVSFNEEQVRKLLAVVEDGRLMAESDWWDGDIHSVPLAEYLKPYDEALAILRPKVQFNGRVQRCSVLR